MLLKKQSEVSHIPAAHMSKLLNLEQKVTMAMYTAYDMAHNVLVFQVLYSLSDLIQGPSGLCRGHGIFEDGLLHSGMHSGEST